MAVSTGHFHPPGLTPPDILPPCPLSASTKGSSLPFTSHISSNTKPHLVEPHQRLFHLSHHHLAEIYICLLLGLPKDQLASFQAATFFNIYQFNTCSFKFFHFAVSTMPSSRVCCWFLAVLLCPWCPPPFFLTSLLNIDAP